MNEIEQIEQFLNQQLKGNDLARFKERLKSDPDWQKQVADYQVLFNGFDVLRRESFEEKLRSWNEEKPMDEINLVSDQQETQRGKTRSLYRWAAAASVLLLVAVGTWYFSNQGSALQRFAGEQSALVAMHFDNDKSSEGEQLDQQKILQQAEIDYGQKNFLAGIDKVKTIAADSPYYSKAQYLSGHAWFQLQEYAKAATAFEKVLEHPIVQDFKSREEASWTYLLALTQIYLENPNEANKNKLQTKLPELLKTADPKNIYLKKEQELKQLLN